MDAHQSGEAGGQARSAATRSGHELEDSRCVQ